MNSEYLAPAKFDLLLLLSLIIFSPSLSLLVFLTSGRVFLISWSVKNLSNKFAPAVFSLHMYHNSVSLTSLFDILLI